VCARQASELEHGVRDGELTPRKAPGNAGDGGVVNERDPVLGGESLPRCLHAGAPFDEDAISIVLRFLAAVVRQAVGSTEGLQLLEAARFVLRVDEAQGAARARDGRAEFLGRHGGVLAEFD